VPHRRRVRGARGHHADRDRAQPRRQRPRSPFLPLQAGRGVTDTGGTPSIRRQVNEMKTNPKRSLAAFLVLALTAACGGNGDDSGDSGLMELRVAQSSTSVGYFTLYVAQEEGFFEAEGLDIGEPSVLGGDSKVAAALAGGAADV